MTNEELQERLEVSGKAEVKMAEKTCRWCDYQGYKDSPFGCPFKNGEPPYCAGFVWDKKGELYNV